MSFLDHLDELRKRLIYVVASIGISFAICFAFSTYIYKFLSVPVVAQLQKARRVQQAASGTLAPEQLQDGEIVQYTFTQETAVNNVKVPLGTTIPVKKITQDGKPVLVLASRWGIGTSVVEAGTPIGPTDLLIAATARRHGRILVTHNRREFDRVSGLTIEDWY